MKNVTKKYTFEFNTRELIALQKACLEIWSQLEDNKQGLCCYRGDKKIYQKLNDLFSLEFTEFNIEE